MEGATEPGHEQQASNEKHSPAIWFGAFAALLLATYVLCPVAFIYPVYAYYGGWSKVPSSADAVITVVFYPLEHLARVCPPYGKMVEAEGKWLGM